MNAAHNALCHVDVLLLSPVESQKQCAAADKSPVAAIESFSPRAFPLPVADAGQVAPDVDEPLSPRAFPLPVALAAQVAPDVDEPLSPRAFPLPVALAAQVAPDVDEPLSPQATRQLVWSAGYLSIVGGARPSTAKTVRHASLKLGSAFPSPKARRLFLRSLTRANRCPLECTLLETLVPWLFSAVDEGQLAYITLSHHPRQVEVVR